LYGSQAVTCGECIHVSSEAIRDLPGNSLSADDGSASIAQVREACPRVTGYNNSINKRTEFAGAPAIGGGAMRRRQALFPGSSRVASNYNDYMQQSPLSFALLFFI
jgi:hypothetical protein